MLSKANSTSISYDNEHVKKRRSVKITQGRQTIGRLHLICRIAVVAMFSSLLAACGGGGVGSPAPQQQPPPVIPVPPPLPFEAPPVPIIDSDDPFNTTEFQANYGLQSLNAHTAYAQGATGEDILVAIIDDGVDINHPDLDNNISPLSVDIRTGNFADIDTQQTHGTQIAGIIAAERNNTGVHGVAYEAELLVIRALDAESSSIADVAAGIDYARENGAKILNLSVTADSIPGDLRASLDRAVDAGMLIVISAGNNLPSDEAINRLDAISLYTTFASANGQALAVGAVDKANNMAFFSNRPGTGGADFYLLAPGVDIISSDVGGGIWQLTPDPDPQFFGVDLDASGTSFAAPHVSGAAAVLWQMFPNLAASEVAEILLTSSVDVGDVGVDAISGHGIIDLGAAVQPKGALTIPMGVTSLEKNSPVAASFTVAGAAFGDSLSTTDAFAGAFLQDRFRRAFSIDFRAFTNNAPTALNLAGQVYRRSQNRFVSIPLGESSQLSISARQNHWSERTVGSRFSHADFRPEEIEFTDVAFIAKTVFPGGRQFELRRGYSAPSALTESLGVAQTHQLNTRNTTSDLEAVVGRGTSISVQQRLSHNFDAIVSYSRGSHRNVLTDSMQHNALTEIGLVADLSSTIRLVVTGGKLDEEGSALGLTGTGAFSGIERSRTQFIKMGARTYYAGWSLFGTFLSGTTDIEVFGAGLFEDFSLIQSSSFSIGLQKTGLIGEDDFLAISLSQPLRVDRGRATINIATEIDADDQITRSNRSLSLSPAASEYDYQVTYKVPISGMILSSDFLYRRNPGHSAIANSDISLLFQLSSSF